VKIPKEIKTAIRKAGKHNKIATENNKIVREWLEEHMSDLGWEDYLIDSIELGNNGSQSLIEFLERDCDDMRNNFSD